MGVLSHKPVITGNTVKLKRHLLQPQSILAYPDLPYKCSEHFHCPKVGQNNLTQTYFKIMHRISHVLVDYYMESEKQIDGWIQNGCAFMVHPCDDKAELWP